MVQTPTKPLALDAFLLQPETKPASEYIDGQIIQKPMPEADRSIIQTDLATAINTAIKPTRQGRALTELRCTFAGRSIVPDIAVLPWSMIPRTEEGRAAGELSAAPEWMIEILSPKQSQTRVVKKILHALEHGTQLGWLVDPTEDCVFSYRPNLPTVPYDQPNVELYDQPNVELPVPEFATNFRLTVGELVSWLYE